MCFTPRSFNLVSLQSAQTVLFVMPGVIQSHQQCSRATPLQKLKIASLGKTEDTTLDFPNKGIK